MIIGVNFMVAKLKPSEPKGVFLSTSTHFYLQNLHPISIDRNAFYAAIIAGNEIVFGEIFIAERLNNSAFEGADGVTEGFVISGIEAGL